jgi:hypothetical protein
MASIGHYRPVSACIGPGGPRRRKPRRREPQARTMTLQQRLQSHNNFASVLSDM